MLRLLKEGKIVAEDNTGFAVVDVETTGFGKGDRVIEIGVVLLDHRLRVVDEYETLIDPERDLGPTHVHGITPKMISMAPSFGEVAPAIANRIGGRVIVAHNLIFDERMLGQEYGRLKATFDPGVRICTLKLTKQKLPAACQMHGVEPPQHHRALADARASAGLLKALNMNCAGRPLRLGSVPGDMSVRTHRRCADENSLVFDRLLSRVVYNEGDTRLLQYMDLLDWVLDDLVLTADERQHLNFLAEELSLTEAEVAFLPVLNLTACLVRFQPEQRSSLPLAVSILMATSYRKLNLREWLPIAVFQSCRMSRNPSVT